MLPEFSTVVQILTAAVVILCLIYKDILLAIVETAPRDWMAAVRSTKWQIALFTNKFRNITLGRMFEDNVRKTPNKICLYFEDDKWTFQQVSKISNQLGNYFYEKGFRKGDAIALFMENGPEYVFVCLGLSKIGVITSLVNSNLRLEPLKHYLEVSGCKAVIFKPELFSALEDLKKIGGLEGTPLFCWAKDGVQNLPASSVIDLTEELKQVSSAVPIAEKFTNVSDRMMYMGTSGTTGLPKAVIFSHIRFFSMAFGLNIMLGVNADDVNYVCLPLYHSTGFGSGMGGLLSRGVPLAIRKKFSATNFWSDCCKYNATIAPYIGEVCRYLMQTPPSPYDTQHKVRLMVGAGLRAEIWQSFQDRFKVPMINEFYGSTEGNCNIINIDGRLGAAGFYPRWASPIVPVRLIKVNENTMEPIRDPVTGKCIRCQIGESGELIGKIDSRHPAKTFEGYTDSKSTNSKILRNVFKDGDSFFRSGDLLIRDIYGYFYFKDRQGDTFRWKAENVSTFQVESVITRSIGLKDVAVYGVAISGYDGKAGMAAIADTEKSLDLKKLSADVTASLPSYARPVFLRVSSQLETTGSFKMMKNELKKEGLLFPHPEDPIYILQKDKYEPMTHEIYQSLSNGNLRI